MYLCACHRHLVPSFFSQTWCIQRHDQKYNMVRASVHFRLFFTYTEQVCHLIQILNSPGHDEQQWNLDGGLICSFFFFFFETIGSYIQLRTTWISFSKKQVPSRDRKTPTTLMILTFKVSFYVHWMSINFYGVFHIEKDLMKQKALKVQKHVKVKLFSVKIHVFEELALPRYSTQLQNDIQRRETVMDSSDVEA